MERLGQRERVHFSHKTPVPFTFHFYQVIFVSCSEGFIHVRPCRGMVPTVSSHHHHHLHHHHHHHQYLRVEAFAASARLGFRLAGEGRCHNSSGGAQVIGAARRSSHSAGPPNVKRTAPTWVTSPISQHDFSGKHQPPQHLTAASINNALCAPARKDVIAVVENGGLLVRGGGGGGGGGVIASAPLGALVVVTAYLTADLERRTKLGAVVGSPLLSFSTFCLLR